MVGSTNPPYQDLFPTIMATRVRVAIAFSDRLVVGGGTSGFLRLADLYCGKHWATNDGSPSAASRGDHGSYLSSRGHPRLLTDADHQACSRRRRSRHQSFLVGVPAAGSVGFHADGLQPNLFHVDLEAGMARRTL